LQITVRGANDNDASAIASVTAQVQELHAHSYQTLFKTNAATSDLEDAVRQYLSDNSQRALVAHSAKRNTSTSRVGSPSSVRYGGSSRRNRARLRPLCSNVR